MKILEVSRYKNNFADHQLPFVAEQGKSLQAAGCQVDYFLVKGNYLTAVKALKAKIRDFKPDVVHAHYGLSGITAALAKLFSSSSSFSFSLVITFHNGETHNWHVNLMTSLMSLRAKHVIYVASHIRDLVYFKARSYSIIPCGVSLEDCVVVDAHLDTIVQPVSIDIGFGDVVTPGPHQLDYPVLLDEIYKILFSSVKTAKEKLKS